MQVVVVQSLSLVRLFCDPVGCSSSGSSVHEISQARILERVAISFSRGSSLPRIEPASLVAPALGGGFFILSHLGSPMFINTVSFNKYTEFWKSYSS